MAGFSDYAENKVLDHLTGRASWTMPSGCYVLLHTADPTDTGTVATFGDSTRKAVTWSAASSGSITSSGTPAAQWNTITASGTITHFSLWDASTAGNCLFTGSLVASKAVTSGNVFQLDTITLSIPD